MPCIDYAVKQQKLEEQIKRLASTVYDEDDNELYGIFCVFLQIYDDDFRHRYSKFYPLILEISEAEELSFDYLVSNLSALLSLAKASYDQSLNNDENTDRYENLYTQLYKLDDHLNLEIARFQESSVHEMKTEDLTEQYNQTKNALEEAKEQIDDLKNKASNMQTEYVSILGIFSSVVLAFIGGITFTASVLKTMNATSIYRLLLIVVLLAAVLINVLYMLINFIVKINNRRIAFFDIAKVNKYLFYLVCIIVGAWAVDVTGLVYFIHSKLAW